MKMEEDMDPPLGKTRQVYRRRPHHTIETLRLRISVHLGAISICFESISGSVERWIRRIERTQRREVEFRIRSSAEIRTCLGAASSLEVFWMSCCNNSKDLLPISPVS